MRGAVIESLLCHGKATVPATLRSQIGAAITPFETRGLARLKGVTLEITPDGLPYARTIAALFDGYRQDSVRKFSSAV
jgi:oxygen-independent coproporphyrinogen-3 oxidase